MTESELKRFNISASTIPEEFGNLTFLRRLIFEGNRRSGSIPWQIGEIATLEELLSHLKKKPFPKWHIHEGTHSFEYFSVDQLIRTEDFGFDWSKIEFPQFGGYENDAKIRPELQSVERSYSSNTREFDKNRFLLFLLLQLIMSIAGIYLITVLPVHLELVVNNPMYHSLFINCGGKNIAVVGNNYEEDLNTKGQSNFAPIETRWAYSITGVYMGNENANSLATATNEFDLNVTALTITRLHAFLRNHFKYYGLCMRKGSYKVMLHFAEIMFTDDQTFASHGRRIFDVSIQGKLVLKDFNIAEEAGGVGIGITKEFNDVWVNGSTLEVHLYWAGKGTTSIPEEDFEVDTRGLSAEAIVGIVVASCAAVVLLLVLLWMKGCFGGKDLENKELRALDLQTGYFTLRQIKDATNNFDPSNKNGEGGFWPVYKGTLSDGAVIAVKQLSSRSKQGYREFVNEIGMISALQHPNLVKLYGCCIKGNQLLLVYEYLENNSLALALFGIASLTSNAPFLVTKLSLTPIFFSSGKEEEKLNLDRKTKKKICIEIVKGLAYLHEESRHMCCKDKETFLHLLVQFLVRKFPGKALGMLNIALICTNPSPTLRPSMSFVVSMLEGKVPVQAPIIMHSSDNQDARFKAFEILSQDSQTRGTTFSQENQTQTQSSMSMDGPWKDSSVSLQTTDETREYSSSSMLLDKDLYDVNLL
ncbi:hypothetical protein Dsin_021999 [Dipteronia sinensis]|uniref:non-specific serine/threonine protein kinase n=1 Tax=Dipteronia sinensis TaxID=43782 RepID=A0AAE0A1P7_9ROSI|nr:hypothetical protein Dsin_021999 [Dipteronia sinensis]